MFLLVPSDLKFCYQRLGYKKQTLCRQLSLSNVKLPWTEELAWDCPVVFEDEEPQIEVSVFSSEGKGGTYIFKIPEENKISK